MNVLLRKYLSKILSSSRYSSMGTLSVYQTQFSTEECITAEVPCDVFDDEKDRPIDKIESRTIIASKREKDRLFGFEYYGQSAVYIYSSMLVQQTQCLASL